MAFKGRNISLIMASLTSGLIGTHQGLPWSDKDDLQWFKSVTMGHTLIMGRRTLDTLPKPLNGRKLVVLSEQKILRQETEWLYYEKNLEAALDRALVITEPEQEIFIAGGTSVYLQAIPYVDRFYISRISQDKMVPLTDEQITNGAHSPFPLPWDTWPQE